MNLNIFKAYDIRGIYPDEINKYDGKKIGKAFVKFLKKKNKKKLNIIIGQDNRISSPDLSKYLKQGILEQGANIIDIGLTSTPMFYFAAKLYNCDGGLMVTASHNPPEYNGFKIIDKGASPIGENSGLKEIKKIVLRLESNKNAKKNINRKNIKRRNVLKKYLDFNFSISKLDFKKLKTTKLKIGIDTANAVSGILINELKKQLPCKIYHLFPKLDGRFPNHLANPLEEKNIKDLKELVKKEKLDLGIAFDGDGDRIVFIDEKGKTIPSDFITCLMSQILLKDKPKSKILYNICSSNIIKDVVEENGGVAIAGKIGHTFIKERMKKDNVIFAGEFSGHYFLGSPYFFEIPLFVLFKILNEISYSKRTMSQLVNGFKRYSNSGQVNFKVADKKNKIKLIEKEFKNGKISHLDGIRIDFKDYWFNVRPSNTENLLRVIVEAKTKSLMQGKLKKIKRLIIG
jgi:phosphomannomutase